MESTFRPGKHGGYFQVHWLSSSVVTSQSTTFPVQWSLFSVLTFQFSGHFQVTRTKTPCHAWDHALVNHAKGQSSTPGCTHCHQTLDVMLSTLYAWLYALSSLNVMLSTLYAWLYTLSSNTQHNALNTLHPSATPGSLVTKLGHARMTSYLRVTTLCLVTS